MKQAMVHSLETSLYHANTSILGRSQGRDASPNRVKIQQIAEKMQTMNVVQDDDKNTKREQYELKIKNLEEKLTRSQMAEETKFKIMKDQIMKLNEGI